MAVSAMNGREPLTRLQRLILEYVKSRSASYVKPVPSSEIALALRISWTYAREQAHELVKRGMLEVRVGPGGGYYLAPDPPVSPSPGYSSHGSQAAQAVPADASAAPSPGGGPVGSLSSEEGAGGAASPDHAEARSVELVTALRQVASELCELADALGDVQPCASGASRRSPELVRARAEEVLEALRRLRQATRAVRGAGAVAVMRTRW